MKEGDKFVFLMPPEIGPGDQMGKISIPPGHVLVFTIELLEVTIHTTKMEGPNKEGWEFLAKNKREKDVEILPSGLM
jgi:FKBP-type peptidyl-prolyl cis-trans isomerase